MPRPDACEWHGNSRNYRDGIIVQLGQSLTLNVTLEQAAINLQVYNATNTRSVGERPLAAHRAFGMSQAADAPESPGNVPVCLVDLDGRLDAHGHTHVSPLIGQASSPIPSAFPISLRPAAFVGEAVRG